MRRAGLMETCHVKAILNSPFGRSYFIGYECGKATFTTDIKWARAYKSAKRASGKIPEMAKTLGVDEKELDVIQYRP